jgi:hypothetical protein
MIGDLLICIFKMAALLPELTEFVPATRMGIVRKVLLGLENRAGCIFSLLLNALGGEGSALNIFSIFYTHHRIPNKHKTTINFDTITNNYEVI